VLEPRDADGQKGNGASISIADTKSLRLKDPQRHPLTSLTKDAMAMMKFSKAPPGVNVVYSLHGPKSLSNPADTSSWCWAFGAAGKNKTAAAKAVTYTVDFLKEIVEQGYLVAKLSVPASEKHGPFTINSRDVGERVELTRCFTTRDGKPCTIKEFVNFHIVTAKNFPPAPRKLLQRFLDEHPKLFTVSTCAPHTDLVNTLPASAAPSTTPKIAGARKPAAMKTQKVISKTMKTHLKPKTMKMQKTKAK
jgi:hypothetical protein